MTTKEKYTELQKLLQNENEQHVKNYVAYCSKTENAKDRQQHPKNAWFARLSTTALANYFMQVKDIGLVLDGVHVTIQKTGLSYDYVAYKNRMLNKYPNSIIDVQLVYKGDTYEFKKVSGRVLYTHEMLEPFEQKDDMIIGGYCIIKNERGEFLTTLTSGEFMKHRSVAKTDYIWKEWYPEMCKKTLIKKAVKVHYDDLYVEMDKEDNKQIDLDQKQDLSNGGK